MALVEAPVEAGLRPSHESLQPLRVDNHIVGAKHNAARESPIKILVIAVADEVLDEAEVLLERREGHVPLVAV